VSRKDQPRRKPVEYKCAMCGGQGTVKERDERGRWGDVTCPNCGGQGTVSGG
jgi:DNA-directed RNA polymerase subunit RPC12/RpoP